jgi:hypothetical protein
VDKRTLIAMQPVHRPLKTLNFLGFLWYVPVFVENFFPVPGISYHYSGVKFAIYLVI